MVLYLTGNNAINLDSFGVEYIPKEIKKYIGKILKQIFLEYKHLV